MDPIPHVDPRSRTERLVARIAIVYGPLIAGAASLAIVGRLLRWDWADAPLTILALPFSIVPVWLRAPPEVVIATCAVIAVALAVLLRRLRDPSSSLTRIVYERVAPGVLSLLLVALVSLWTLSAVVSTGVFVHSHWFGPWPKLRAAVAGFEVPRGFEKVSSAEAGSEACFISCDEPRISLVLKTTLSSVEACRSLEASVRHVARNVGPPPKYVAQPPNASCFLYGDLRLAGYSDAHLFAAVLLGGDIPKHSWLLANVEQREFAASDTVVALLFNSGID